MNQDKLIQLYKQFYNEVPDTIRPLPKSGSHRLYFRMSGKDKSCIGVYNKDIAENTAFLGFSASFSKEGLNVPRIYLAEKDSQYYIIEDLGDTSFHEIIMKHGFEENSNSLLEQYKQILKELIRFQVDMKDKMNYELCIPRQKFDRQSILWDLNHFKYFFLKISGIPFDEQNLEQDFLDFSDSLEEVDGEYFMFRDFQSRNIMLFKDEYYFIDYQGGRKGALQYDLASILFEAKTSIPYELREELLQYYLVQLEKNIKINREKFLEKYYLFVLIRVLQAMGTYGLRGWVEKKVLFLQSIPAALKNLEWLIENEKFPYHLKELTRLVEQLIKIDKFKYSIPITGDKLLVRIQSFSYRKPLPDDLSGHGGGYIFDCRAIDNPGRFKEYKSFTGKDKIIQDYFREKTDMHSFLEDQYKIIERSINSYIKKEYKHLQVNFGCTGGRHRSVFAAESIAKKIEENFNIDIEIDHREIK